MKAFIKYFTIRFIRIVFYIFKFIPINKNRILCMSYSGKQYSCNPKAISECLQKKGEFEIIWLLNNNIENFPETIKKVKSRTIKFYYYHWTSSFIISNGITFKEIPIRKGQRLINTWHGGGAYKRIIYDNPSLKRNKFDKLLLENFDMKRTTFISSCKNATKYVIRSGLGHSGEIMEVGSPRNDILLNMSNEEKKHICIKIKQKYHINLEDKILLYAPTFRDSKDLNIYDIDFNSLCETLRKKFGGNWVVMTRMHQVLDNKSNIDMNTINVNNYYDMQELLICCDILITDYSSSIWDYSLTNKPCFLYVPDLDDYMNERNFYVNIDEWPYEYARTNSELNTLIQNFSYEDLIKRINYHHNIMGSFEKGRSCEMVYNYIMKGKVYDKK